jgi:hypothetical protein
VGDIHFPNLDFEYSQINFGCILNDTTKTMLVRVTNPSTVESAFSWTFLEDEDPMRTSNAGRKPHIPVNQVPYHHRHRRRRHHHHHHPHLHLHHHHHHHHHPLPPPFPGVRHPPDPLAPAARGERGRGVRVLRPRQP